MMFVTYLLPIIIAALLVGAAIYSIPERKVAVHAEEIKPDPPPPPPVASPYSEDFIRDQLKQKEIDDGRQ